MWRTGALLTPTLMLAFVAGCSSNIEAPSESDAGAATGGSGSVGTAGRGGTGSGNAQGGGPVNPGSGGSGTSTGGTGASGGTGATGGDAPLAGAPSTAACPTQEVPRTPLRRLTRFEYANSVKALLNVDTSAAAELPADEITNGFDNQASVLTVSALHAEKYVLVSETFAKAAVQNVAQLSTCDTGTTGEEACALEFARSFGRRAYRRPLSAEEQTELMTAYAAGKTGGSHAEGLEVMIRAALQSPNFLYRLETTTPATASALVPLSQFELATRLSYLLWAAGPDDALLDAAERGELATKEQVAEKARQMLTDPKSRSSVANFVNQWTGAKRLEITSKNSALFPLFSDAMRAAMQRELPAFVEHVLWSGDHKLSTLLTAPVAFVSGPLAQLYGVTAPAGSETVPALVNLPEAQGRAGILTQAGFLSVQAHPDQTSPVLRGKFVRAMLLCEPPDPPPDDVDISLPEVDQTATARERFGAHLTAGNSCNGCHALMDPIGLAFEHFDAMGQYRDLDNGRTLDVSGEIVDAADPALAGPFTGVAEMAQKLATSQQVRDCVATQWFRFASGRREGLADSCSLGSLHEAFSASGGDLVELLVGVTQTDSFWYRSQVTQ